jgi:DNA-directed RNA polymerase subunit RPC12/RpoP
MLPYITNHPNVANYIGDNMACTHCGETEKYEKLDGYYYYTNTNKYQVYRCLTCGSLFRDRKALPLIRPTVI